MHKLLKLQHHSHTGRVIQHHHTSYRAILVLFAISAVFIAALQYTAHAADIFLTATAPASDITTAATIDEPIDGTTVDTPTIAVKGTCEFVLPTSIISIYTNGNFAGSTSCSSSGLYTITISLVPGINNLVAKTSNITGGTGPDSTSVSVTYVPKPVPEVPTSGSTGKSPTKRPTTPVGTGPLLLGLPNSFVIFGPNKPASLFTTITGGIGPYEVRIDWGDGHTQTARKLSGVEQQLTHKYQAMRSHFITVEIVDSTGASRTYSIAAVTPYLGSVPATSTPVGPWFDTPLALRIYGLYLVTIGVAALIWIDARHLRPQPVFVFKKRRQKKKPRA